MIVIGFLFDFDVMKPFVHLFLDLFLADGWILFVNLMLKLIDGTK